MFDLLRDHKLKVYVSCYSPEPYNVKTHKLITYTTGIDFVISSVLFSIYIPFCLFFHKFCYGYRTLYMPVFHPWNLIMALWGRIFGYTSVVTVHDVGFHTGKENPLLEGIQTVTMRLSSEVVFLSGNQRQKAHERDFKRGIVIPHPFVYPETIKTNDLVHESSMKVLFLGRLDRNKGVDHLKDIDAFLRASGSELTIAGQPGDFNTSDLSGLKVIDRFLMPAELNRLLMTHHILLLPYASATQSGVIPLGLLANVPMIITKVGGLEEQIPADCAVFVEPNKDAIEKGLSKIIQDAALFRRVKTNMLKYKEVYRFDYMNKVDDLFH